MSVLACVAFSRRQYVATYYLAGSPSAYTAVFTIAAINGVWMALDCEADALA
ncbi:hypothetical protein ASPSYDRAFT_47197 [Aspergillus sydowii CBS 593.65]|uniref:Uncharacterized protein n=1 Tax=Aspergillus sydowii CBS 593.65 TaxID=1036612 RepID=A0A1L9TCB5_9EURO|nr:uncharacterized protein ASPSYDRAFT_47197 [Aspergillus sydowii CBS 593.65]OJJ56923.1 hypothetical protein ASPSYDRAFT_47197 [Aspergillus sydowii CBS 593.65]